MFGAVDSLIFVCFVFYVVMQNCFVVCGFVYNKKNMKRMFPCSPAVRTLLAASFILLISFAIISLSHLIQLADTLSSNDNNGLYDMIYTLLKFEFVTFTHSTCTIHCIAEYIVGFREYRHVGDHDGLIWDILTGGSGVEEDGSIGHTNVWSSIRIDSPYRVIPRDNAATRLFPSDFAVVEVWCLIYFIILITIEQAVLVELTNFRYFSKMTAQINDPSVVSALRSSGRVKYVVRQRQFALIDDEKDEGKVEEEDEGSAEENHDSKKPLFFRRLSVDELFHSDEGETAEILLDEDDTNHDTLELDESDSQARNSIRSESGRQSTRWFVEHQKSSACASSGGGGGGVKWNANANNSSITDCAHKHFPPNSFLRADPYSDINPFSTLSGSEFSIRNMINDSQVPIFAHAGARKLLLNQEITDKLHADTLWQQGFKGQGVHVAVFDTGLRKDHPAFAHIVESINFSSEQTTDDSLGHGTFVAGIIASRGNECYGFAPEAQLHIFKVFTSQQISYTSWFLDAFNYVLLSGINILNLSIGGPDYLDTPFVDKVWELSANNVIVVSAIGNDGPLYGTLNNPADQTDVIGVGGINDGDQIASFSSRGMTTGEFANGGYGRVKPDIVTYGSKVRGTGRYGNCNTLSGTSVACPVITGALALLASTVPEDRRWTLLNPASIKQILHESSQRVPRANIFEQGMGKFDLLRAHTLLHQYMPRATFFPPHLDLTDCPYMWPHCAQPTYHSAMPIVFNITVLNALGVTGKFADGYPRWIPGNNGHVLDVHFSPSETLWPWSGFLGVQITINHAGRFFEGVAEGTIEAKITSPPNEQESTVLMKVKVPVIQPPLKQRRLLWDQYHNMQYPPGYIPRDNLNLKDDILDWNGDHPHTNFRDMFNFLRSKGYFIEVLQEDLTQFDARRYGTLLLVDTEDEFTDEERRKIKNDVEKYGLSLLVLAEWYNVEVMKKIKFFDDNTHELWTPLTGGANIPALNALLEPFGIMFGTDIYNGEINIGGKKAAYASGTSIVRFPEGGRLAKFSLQDQTKQFLFDKTTEVREDTPVLGFYQTNGKGRIVVYGDTTCFDSVQANVAKCFWLLEHMLEFTSRRKITDEMVNIPTFSEPLQSEYLDFNAKYAERYTDVLDAFFKHSKISPRQLISADHLPFMANTTTILDPLDSRDSLEERKQPSIGRSRLFYIFPMLVTVSVLVTLAFILLRRRRKPVIRLGLE